MTEFDLLPALDDGAGLPDEALQRLDLPLQFLAVLGHAERLPDLFLPPALLLAQVLHGVKVQAPIACPVHLVRSLQGFLQDVFQPLLAPLQGAIEGVGAGGQSPLEDDQGEGHVAPPVAGQGSVVLLAHVAG